MKVLHIMLSRGLGGIEQVFLDYTAMLRAEGVEVLPVIHPEAAIRSQVPGAISLPNRGKWDLFAIWQLRKIIAAHKPDLILTHGNRPLSLVKFAAGKTRLIPVAHNYWLKPFKGVPHAIAITEDIAQHLRALRVAKVSVIPNVVTVPEHLPERPPFRTPPVIGTMGRFVHKKGFDVYLQALAELKARKISFTALLGGSGEEEDSLKKLAHKLDIEDKVKFIGWVKDKEEFFRQIDIFCVPSRSEPFGIVLLEAFARSVPVISSLSEGARAITKNGHDAILYDEGRLADDLAYLLSHELLAKNMANNAFETAKNYQPSVVGKKLMVAIQ